nr:hypothetical protein [Marinicella sp. W31]MDC2879066.1 hypothetical protein [Marinicella sp. W31]
MGEISGLASKAAASRAHWSSIDILMARIRRSLVSKSLSENLTIASTEAEGLRFSQALHRLQLERYQISATSRNLEKAIETKG